MEIKHNDSTIKRPHGERVLDAPYVFTNLREFRDMVKDEKTWEVSDRNSITVFKTEGMTIVLTAMKEGAVIKDNTVNGFFTIQVLEGSIRMTTLEGDSQMNFEQMISFHPGVPHSIESISNSLLLLFTFDVHNP
jgi:quercetin dioxygenase-like cupin family protein